MLKRSLIYSLLACVALVYSSCEKKTKGCTDATADNFNLYADEDDGSCKYSKFLEGPFRFAGQKSGSTGTTPFADTFTVTDLGNGEYRLSGLVNCNNIRVMTEGSNWNMVSNDCNISNWQFSFNGANFMFLNFSIFNGSSGSSYSGQVTKL